MVNTIILPRLRMKFFLDFQIGPKTKPNLSKLPNSWQARGTKLLEPPNQTNKHTSLAFEIGLELSVDFFWNKNSLNLCLKSVISDSKFLEEAKFIQSRTGSANLMDKAGYIYHKKRTSKTTVQWTCRERKRKPLLCNATASITNFKITYLGGVHNHPPPTDDELYLGYPTWKKKPKN